MGLLGGRSKRRATIPAWLAAFLLDGTWPGREHDPEGSDAVFGFFAGELADMWAQHGAQLLEEWKAAGRKGLPWAMRELEKRQQEMEQARRALPPQPEARARGAR